MAADGTDTPPPADSPLSGTDTSIGRSEVGPHRDEGTPVTDAAMNSLPQEAPYEVALEHETAEWVRENAHMSEKAREYQSWAPGAQSCVEGDSLAPALPYFRENGSEAIVRFDGEEENGVLIDRKTCVHSWRPKLADQAERQSRALAQNGLIGRWEVPNDHEVGKAELLFQKLGITNITAVKRELET